MTVTLAATNQKLFHPIRCAHPSNQDMQWRTREVKLLHSPDSLAVKDSHAI